MNYWKDFDFNARIFIDYKTENENLKKEIKEFWNTNRDFKFSEIDKQYSNLYNIKLNIGIYNLSLKEISDCHSLHTEIYLLKKCIEDEFSNYLKSNSTEKKTLLNDIDILFKAKSKENRLAEEYVNKIANNETYLKEAYRQLNNIEFNYLLVFASLHSKEDIFMLFNQRGLDSRIINKLENIGLIWIKRNFDNKIIQFTLDDSLKNRLIYYIDKNGIDIYNLEFSSYI